MKNDITTFVSGSIRDSAIGKSRMELIPLELLPKYVIKNLMTEANPNKKSKEEILFEIFGCLTHLRRGYTGYVDLLILLSFELVGNKYLDTLYDLGVHYGAGAEKYGANNFMLGQKLSHIVGSYERHIYKYMNNWKDEAPHERGMLWNALNIKFVTTYYKEDKDICDMLYLYKDGKPDLEYIRDQVSKGE